MADESFNEFVLEQLSRLSGLRQRQMFGGYGLYLDDVFFGILYQGALYFKTDSRTRKDYEAHGTQPFRPNEKQTLKNYLEVPAEILEDSERLVEWVLDAVRAGE